MDPSAPPTTTRQEFQPVRNNITFKDHAGKTALMSWWGDASCPLPPLASWVFYMVHPNIIRPGVPCDFDGCQFQDDLDDDNSLGKGGPFRYEFFFLPGATAEECHVHYRNELEARGTIWRQIGKVKAAIRQNRCGSNEEIWDAYDDSLEETSDGEADKQLPGLVWPRNDGDYSSLFYRGWFFMYPHAEVKLKGADGEACLIDNVLFDPVLLDLDEEDLARFNPMEHPVYVTQRPARNKEGYNAGTFGWMETQKYSHWQEQSQQATEDAMELGWKPW